jgi:hypothetical protein
MTRTPFMGPISSRLPPPDSAMESGGLPAYSLGIYFLISKEYVYIIISFNCLFILHVNVEGRGPCEWAKAPCACLALALVTKRLPRRGQAVIPQIAMSDGCI